MTLRTRLILSLGAIALVLALPALYALWHLDAVTEIARGQQQRHGTAARAIGAIRTDLAQLDAAQRAHLIEPDVATITNMQGTYAELRIQADTLASANYMAAADLAEARVDSLAALSREMDRLFEEDPERASVAHRDLFQPLLENTLVTMDSVAEVMMGRSNDDLQEASRIAGEAAGGTLAALAVAMAIAVLLAVFTTRLVSGPIQRLRVGMAEVAGGRFEVPTGLPYERKDEVGDVSRSFRSMTEQLADLERLKAEFMSIATHELKTPINVIAGYAELMEDRIFGELSERQEEALLSISEQTRVLTQLVNQLLDMSRLEAGGLKLEMDRLVVADLAERIRRTFAVLADRKEIRFRVELDESAPDTIRADGDRLRDQVLGNLLSNALKFTPEGGRVDVSILGEDHDLVIRVSDSGPGIPADQLPHIFDKYYQVGAHARSKGAGLGLTIAHEVVEAHGGSIVPESQEGEGTTFTIRLPVEGHAAAGGDGKRPGLSAAAIDRAGTVNSPGTGDQDDQAGNVSPP